MKKPSGKPRPVSKDKAKNLLKDKPQPLKRAKSLGNRAKFCETCQQIKRDGPRHHFDFPDHVLRPLTSQERQGYAADPEVSGQYIFDFGRHKKKSLTWVKTHAPSYIAWMVRERVYDKKENLKNALVAQDMFPVSLLNESDEKQRCRRALEIIDSWKESEPKEQQLAEHSKANDEAMAESHAIVPASQQKNVTEKKRRHLKYMNPSQQTEEYATKVRATLVERKHYGQALQRMSAVEFVQAMQAYGLMEDLTGKPCPYSGCGDTKQHGFGGRILGGLCSSSKGKSPGSDISLKDCCYRCQHCRRRVPVTHQNRLFPPTARGGYGPSILTVNASYFLANLNHKTGLVLGS